jgi:ribosomal protein S18 acetylase RimI-like enzyme
MIPLVSLNLLIAGGMHMTTDSLSKEITIGRLEDLEEARQCARTMSASEPWITLKRTYRDAFMILTDPSREIYVAHRGDEVVGFAVLIMQGAFVGYIQTIGVMPEWRNRGIGTHLVQFAEERIFADFPNVFMCVSSFNKDALRLYERLGYEIVGEIKDLIVPGHSEILLRKTIGALTEFRRQRAGQRHEPGGYHSPDANDPIE